MMIMFLSHLMFMKSMWGSMSIRMGLRKASTESRLMRSGAEYLAHSALQPPGNTGETGDPGTGPLSPRPRSDMPPVTVEWSAQSSVNIWTWAGGLLSFFSLFRSPELDIGNAYSENVFKSHSLGTIYVNIISL